MQDDKNAKMLLVLACGGRLMTVLLRQSRMPSQTPENTSQHPKSAVKKHASRHPASSFATLDST